MIYCKVCKKFAKIKSVLMNGADEVKIIGSCKHCGFDENPKFKDEAGKPIPFTNIPESNITYTDFEELGIDR